MYSDKTISEAAEFLDTKVPLWWRRIVEKIDMFEYKYCIIGQLFLIPAGVSTEDEDAPDARNAFDDAFILLTGEKYGKSRWYSCFNSAASNEEWTAEVQKRRDAELSHGVGSRA